MTIFEIALILSGACLIGYVAYKIYQGFKNDGTTTP
jgi:hypothetical protein